MNKIRFALIVVLATVLSFLAIPGCRSLKLFPPGQSENQEKAGEVAIRDPREGQVARPSRFSLRVAPYVFVADSDLKRDLPLFTELASLRDQVYKELNLPSAETPVYVYLFEDRPTYEAYLRANYPKLPRRRAFFIAQPRMGGEDLLVLTFRGERIKQDLRHELTHALLHSVLKDVPLWLDEGLAEYFELPPDHQGVNDGHLNIIRRSTTELFRPNLARLETLTEVPQMTPAEYRESWAWVHLMLRSQPETRNVLLAYLQQLRTTPTPGPLRSRLTQVVTAPEENLMRHVAQLEVPAVIVPTARRR